jgi:hypothetical protein
MSKLEEVKVELNSRVIEAFNQGFFDTLELIRIQDAIEDASDEQTVGNEMMNHHIRVMSDFKSKRVDELVEKMKAMNPTVN